MGINIDEINAAGLDEKVVRSIARRLSNIAKEASSHNIQIFAGAGSATLRFNDRHDAGNLIIAEIDGGEWSGGDGGHDDRFDGLMRGEFE